MWEISIGLIAIIWIARGVTPCERAHEDQYSASARTMLCITPEHLNGIQFAVEPRQEQANMSCTLNNGLDEWLLVLEVLLQGKDLGHAAPVVMISAFRFQAAERNVPVLDLRI